MNHLAAPDGICSDEVILAGIGRLLDVLDPPPADLVHRIRCALDELAADVSWWAPERHTG